MNHLSNSVESVARNALPRISGPSLEGFSEAKQPCDHPDHCLCCRTVIRKTRPWQKFCSPACRRRHWGEDLWVCDQRVAQQARLDRDRKSKALAQWLKTPLEVCSGMEAISGLGQMA